MATALIAYIPVLHAGYRRLFEQHRHADLYILGTEFMSQFRPLTKDLRKLDPEQIRQAIAAWNLFDHIEIATPHRLKNLPQGTITMPDEDLSHVLAEQYFPARAIIYSPIFLRWDRTRSDAKTQPNPDRRISTRQLDRQLMTTAAAAGTHSSDIWRRVGALIAQDGQALLTAYNHSLPTANTAWADGDPRNNFSQGVAIETSIFIHAEATLIAQAAKRGLPLAGASLYVTTFPCPICAKLIASAGITTCYYATGYAMLDGQQILESAGVKLVQVDLGSPSDSVGDPTAIAYPN